MSSPTSEEQQAAKAMFVIKDTGMYTPITPHNAVPLLALSPILDFAASLARWNRRWEPCTFVFSSFSMHLS